MRSKYGNEKVGACDSLREFKRLADLKLLERAGVIKNLRHHVRYELIPAQYDGNGKLVEHACHYEADFVYEENGRTVVEDSKPKIRVVAGLKASRFTGRTPDYVIKRKLMLHVHGISVVEV